MGAKILSLQVSGRSARPLQVHASQPIIFRICLTSVLPCMTANGLAAIKDESYLNVTMDKTWHSATHDNSKIFNKHNLRA